MKLLIMMLMIQMFLQNLNLKKMKNDMAPGCDLILSEYIKCTENMLCPLYVKLFNNILTTGVIPHEWLVGIIVSLYKNKADNHDVNKYRGITLLSCMGKLFTIVQMEKEEALLFVFRL